MSYGATDDFEAATESAALVELLRRRIHAEGAITFHDFMETALYHPQLGYYVTREPMGRQGDYLTSPEVHPIFGALVAKQQAQCWELMGRPAPFDVVEQGAGTGLLARDILRWAQTRAPDFAGALHYRIVEISAALSRRQEETLAQLSPPPNVEWLDHLPDSIEGCLLSNELIDAFPVHRVTQTNGNLLEVYVSHDGGRFEAQLRPLSTNGIARYFADLGLSPGEGCVAEVNLQAVDWMAQAARSLGRGFVLTFDYGYPARELYAPWRRDGTLLCFYRHNPSTDPYARIGKQDITAHVDFTTLMRAGEGHGLATAGLTTQARFLASLGIGAGVDSVARESPDALEEYYARRRAVQELIDPAGLGRIRVLAQRKGVEPGDLLGFAAGDDA
ncbi:MAG: SAM-dependent methyltransferase [Dehalococcoidia bacterium]